MKTKNKIIIAISVVMLLITTFLLIINSYMSQDMIYKNINISGVDVSELNKKQAKQKLEKKFGFGELELKYNGKNYKKNLFDMGFSYDMDVAVNDAYKIGKDENLLKNIIKVTSIKLGESNSINLKYKYDKKKLDEFLAQVSKSIDKKFVNASVMPNGKNVKIIAGSNGKQVEKDKLNAILLEEIEKNKGKNKNISLTIPVQITSPKITYKNLSSINGVIGEFSTKYPVGSTGRPYNVELTARKIDGQLIMPGETASFLKKLGEINAQNGFQTATIILNNEFVDGMGGGVCQVSSTLYNAILLAGLDIVERSRHSLPVHYVPFGRDATVASPSPDLKYKNNYDFPVYISSYANNGVVTTIVYGDVNKAKNIELYSQTLYTIPSNRTYVYDKSLKSGVEVIDIYGSEGYQTQTWKIENGKKIVVSNDTYIPMPTIVIKGTGN